MKVLIESVSENHPQNTRGVSNHTRESKTTEKNKVELESEMEILTWRRSNLFLVDVCCIMSANNTIYNRQNEFSEVETLR